MLPDVLASGLKKDGLFNLTNVSIQNFEINPEPEKTLELPLHTGRLNVSPLAQIFTDRLKHSKIGMLSSRNIELTSHFGHNRRNTVQVNSPN